MTSVSMATRDRRELSESFRELDNLLDDLNNAQISDQQAFGKRLDKQRQHSTFYNSLPSVHQVSAVSPIAELHNKENNNNNYKRGVFVKEVVEEEILFDTESAARSAPAREQSTRRKHMTKSKSPVEAHSGKLVRPHQLQHQLSDTSSIYDEAFDNSRTVGKHLELPPAGGHSHNHNHTHIDHDHDHDDELDELESQLTASSAQTSAQITTLDSKDALVECYTCGERIVGQVITALNRSYHKHHFTCAHCSRELGTTNFYERDSLPYCELDYQQLFSPRCAACNEPILDKVTIALEQTFHPEHFACAACGEPFDADDGFHEQDGRAYCKNDYFELFASKCGGCALPITANYITALDSKWHPECFVCSDCHCPFAAGKFFDIDSAPYCEIHYHARRGSLCATCKLPVIGKCTTAMFRKFHPEHFTCTYCKKTLTKSFKEEQDRPYCFECFDKLYS